MMLLNPPEPTPATQHDLEEAVRQYGPRFLAVARRYLPCEAECADAVQDAMVSALRQLSRFRGMCKLETWLHRIVVNVCLMKLRSQSRRCMPSLEELLPFQNGAVIVDRLDETETHAMLREALSHLPEPQRSVIQLRYFEGFSTNETAELLGTNAAVVKTRLHRGCRALREYMEQRWSDAWD
ncbi:MAG: sigma-70 family RNA polymerase sigma factor [Planctomycetaceae bacterium]|nr:sigma-70 family RNA polymerase sigma factor [Planctomycetaceae bacterium]